MLALTLFLLQASAAQPAVALPPVITVRGVRLQTLKAEVDRCVARRCTPREDIVASVRYAEGLFRTGAYVDAKRVLGRSVVRNRGEARADPLAVSELYLAQATVALHEGDQQVARDAAYSRATVLKAAFPADQPAVLLAEMGVADMILRTDWRAAKRAYAAIADRAAGSPNIAASVALRRALIASRYGNASETEALLAPVIASEGEAMAGYRLAARALAARFARARGDEKATDALLAAIAREPQRTAPTLLWAPPLLAPTDLAGLDFFQRTDTTRRGVDLSTLGWVDVGYLIRPDGTVEEPEILRGSTAREWTGTVLSSVAGRRYAPFTGDGGRYRVERFTLTADYDVPIGSLVRRRFRNPRIEQLDITPGAPSPPAAQG